MQKKSGTAHIVWGGVLLAAALIGLIQIPAQLNGEPATLAGGIVGTLAFVAAGTWLLVIGISRKRTSSAS